MFGVHRPLVRDRGLACFLQRLFRFPTERICSCRGNEALRSIPDSILWDRSRAENAGLMIGPQGDRQFLETKTTFEECLLSVICASQEVESLKSEKEQLHAQLEALEKEHALAQEKSRVEVSEAVSRVETLEKEIAESRQAASDAKSQILLLEGKFESDKEQLLAQLEAERKEHSLAQEKFRVELSEALSRVETLEKDKGRGEVQWCKPPDNCMKFNVNGAARGKPGPAGIGGVLRDNQGKVRMEFSRPFGPCDSNEAEILAIKEAVVLFSDSTWASSYGLVVESDSMNAVKWVIDPNESPSKPRKRTLQISCLRKKFISFQVLHTLREANKEADSLANSGVEKTCVWVHCIR